MPPTLVFLEPCFPLNQREFVRALYRAGAQVIGIGERPARALDRDLVQQLVHYEEVGNVTDPDQVQPIVQRLQKRIHIDRLEAVVEAHVMCAARVREACGIPGTSVRTTYLCRDKPAMKEVLRSAGIPCAQSIGSSEANEISAFAASIGYPVIVKPRDAAGASGTYLCSDPGDLAKALDACYVGRGGSVAVEEYIEGHEGFWDTLVVNSRIAHEFVCHYYPNVLEAMRTRWISPQFIVTNRIAAPGYDVVKRMGRKVLSALQIKTSATHMEWFFGPKGLKFSEIGCRPPGVRAWDLYGVANDMDLYSEWAHIHLYGRAPSTPSRRFSAGITALRPDRDGRISGYDGVEEIHRRYGEWIIDSHLPSPGTPTQPVDAGFMANAWIRLKHPDYDTLRAMLDDIGRTVQVRAH